MTAPDQFLAEAQSLGDRFVRTAVRHQGFVTWISRDAQEAPSPNLEMPKANSLGASVYGGVAGPALFLAQLYAFTGDSSHAQTAVEAARQGIRLAKAALRPSDPGKPDPGALAWPSYYSGGLGVAWAARRVARLCSNFHLGMESLSLLESFRGTASSASHRDVLGGHAGAIPTWLHLAKDGVEWALAEAMDCGAVLASEAVIDGASVHWRYAEARNRHRGLTGYSHGATGYALALDLLDQHTGSDHQALVAGAFEYERGEFNEKEQNWHDLRFPPAANGYGCSTAWCHGAPGIGLGRSLLPARSRDGRIRDEMAMAFRTTRSRLELDRKFPGQNMMYCHGLLGNAECLFEMEQVLDPEAALGRFRDMGAYGIQRYGQAARQEAKHTFVDWPTGHVGTTELSLMKGLAGIGYSLLRMADPKRVPSVLAAPMPTAP